MAPSRTKPATGLLTRGSKPTSLIDSYLATLTSPHTRRYYARALEQLYAYAQTRPITGSLLYDWRTELASRLSSSTVNVNMAAVREFVRFAYRAGFISSPEAWQLMEIKGVPARGTRVGNWLTTQQAQHLLSVPPRNTLRGARNYCILAILLGCGLRLNELAEMEVERMQQRDGRWVFADLPGKGGRIRTVAIPGWVMTAIRGWMKAAKISEGRLIRQLTLKPEGLSKFAIWQIVTKTAAGIGIPKFGPHDLRRTCARLCREAGGKIEQIQQMLGHASIATTQRYLGTVQNLRVAVNDALVF